MAPASPSSSAIPRPAPRLAPVTKATMLSSRVMCVEPAIGASASLYPRKLPPSIVGGRRGRYGSRTNQAIDVRRLLRQRQRVSLDSKLESHEGGAPHAVRDSRHRRANRQCRARRFVRPRVGHERIESCGLLCGGWILSLEQGARLVPGHPHVAVMGSREDKQPRLWIRNIGCTRSRNHDLGDLPGAFQGTSFSVLCSGGHREHHDHEYSFQETDHLALLFLLAIPPVVNPVGLTIALQPRRVSFPSARSYAPALSTTR